LLKSFSDSNFIQDKHSILIECFLNLWLFVNLSLSWNHKLS
jgi:hypothetical protein